MGVMGLGGESEWREKGRRGGRQDERGSVASLAFLARGSEGDIGHLSAGDWVGLGDSFRMLHGWYSWDYHVHRWVQV